jgi:hypothetical protein
LEIALCVGFLNERASIHEAVGADEVEVVGCEVSVDAQTGRQLCLCILAAYAPVMGLLDEPVGLIDELWERVGGLQAWIYIAGELFTRKSVLEKG